MDLPKKFIDKMTNLLKEESSNFFCSLNNSEEKGITINHYRLGKNDIHELIDFDLEKIPKVSNGYYVKNLKFHQNMLSHLGIIYSQDPSAMYPVEMLDIRANDIVLDACSAPGGKSVQILEKLNGTGFLLANEIAYNRSKILYENLNRMGFYNFAISCNSANELSRCNMKFDKILVDAPCGGEGMFRKDNFDMTAYNSVNPQTNQNRQLEILNNIKHLLKDGGRLVYSTCTYDPIENEEVLVKFLEENKNFHLEHLEGYSDVTSCGVQIGKYPTHLAYRRYPHKHKGEGQFMAVIQKDKDENTPPAKSFYGKFSPLSNKDKKILSDNLNTVCDISELLAVKNNDNYYITTQCKNINLEDLNILSVGCLLGSVVNKTFKINHAFYHTFGDRFYNKINLSKEDCLKYLHGEEIDTNQKNGIASVNYKNISLGGGKIVNGKLKNYYPKDLRI